MAKKIRGALVHCSELCKHLRPKMKKAFWRANRVATRTFIKNLFNKHD